MTSGRWILSEFCKRTTKKSDESKTFIDTRQIYHLDGHGIYRKQKTNIIFVFYLKSSVIVIEKHPFIKFKHIFRMLTKGPYSGGIPCLIRGSDAYDLRNKKLLLMGRLCVENNLGRDIFNIIREYMIFNYLPNPK